MKQRVRLLFGVLAAVFLSAFPGLFLNASAQSETRLSLVPAGYFPCAVDGGACNLSSFPNGANVVYGEGANFIQVPGVRRQFFMCTPDGLGVSDPSPGRRKTCYVNLVQPPSTAQPSPAMTAPAAAKFSVVPPGYTACANDGSVCRVTSNSVDVVYGEGGNFTSAWARTADFTCLPEDLGVADPSPGRIKTCYTRPTILSAPPPGYTPCAVDGGSCTVASGSTVDIVYGEGARFTSAKAQSGSFTCLPGNLGVADPAPFRQKRCFILPLTQQSTLSTPLQVRWSRCASEYNPKPDGTEAGATGFSANFCDIPLDLRSGSNAQSIEDRTAFVAFGNDAGSFYMPVSVGLLPIPCNNRLFGDPTPGATKHCSITIDNIFSSAALQIGWSRLTEEGRSSALPGGSTSVFWMRYGSASTPSPAWQLTPVFQQVVDCSNLSINGYDSGVQGPAGARSAVTFDPAPGTGKVCETKPIGVEASFAHCANEGQDCVTPGSNRYVLVRYGSEARGRYIHRIFKGARLSCNNIVMGGDPASGVPKTCSVMTLQ